MLKPERIITYLLTLSLVAVIAWMKMCSPDVPVQERVVLKERTIRDTVIIPSEIKYVRLPAKNVFYKDTIEQIIIEHDTVYVKPFIARADTSFFCLDSLNLAFLYPQMVFTIHAKSRPDTNVRTTIIRDSVILENKRSVWEDIATHTGAALVGFLLGRTK
jgi:hypothetical protein